MTAPDYTVRDMRPEDVDAVTSLWQETARRHAEYNGVFWDWSDRAAEHTRSHLAEVLDKPDVVHLVAVGEGDRLIGFARGGVRHSLPVFATNRSAYVWDVVIAPDSRRRGVGSALMDALLQRFRQLGADDVQLKVAVANEPAQTLYHTLGLHDVMKIMYKRL